MPRRLLIPTLSTVLMVAVLLGLGVWQLQRRDWKLSLLARVEAAERDPPVPLAPGLPPFAKVSATGRLRMDLAAGYGAEVRDGVLGTQLVVPLERADGPPVLVDLGWVPDGTRRGGTVAGETTVQGFIRPGERPGWFSAADNPATRRFYTLDPPAIGAALGLAQVAPFVLVAVGNAARSGAPDPARHLPLLPNNHLQYAITWFSLAIVALAVFIAYVRKGERA